MDWGALPAHVFLLHAWGTTSGHSWNFPSWSISAEAFAYLAFPLYLRAARLPWQVGLVVAAAVFVALWIATAAAGVRLTAMMTDFGIIRITAEFLIGVALWRTAQAVRAPPGITRAALIAALAGLAALLHIGASDLLLVPLLATIVFLLAQLADQPKGNALRSSILVWLGEISYSTYMVHWFVQLAFMALLRRGSADEATATLAVWLAMWVVIYAASAAGFHLVERPIRIRLRHALRPRASAAAAVSPPTPQAGLGPDTPPRSR
jgi:peptidoglycan/LPS O-acetylase OafA/YrhL